MTQYAELLKIATLARRLASIAEAHRIAGYESPTSDSQVQLVWKGIRRSKGVKQDGKLPVMTDDLRRALASFRSDLKGIRDRALILLGFCGGFRRSELVALDVSDLKFVNEGILVTIRRSKTDQEGSGMVKAVPYASNPSLCPVRALQVWLRASAITEGALFRPAVKGGKLCCGRLSDKSVATIVKGLIEKSGLDSKNYSGHSLRSGFVTQAAEGGASDHDIMRTTGHKSRAMVGRYIRNVDIWKANAAGRLGL